MQRGVQIDIRLRRVVDPARAAAGEEFVPVRESGLDRTSLWRRNHPSVHVFRNIALQQEEAALLARVTRVDCNFHPLPCKRCRSTRYRTVQ